MADRLLVCGLVTALALASGCRAPRRVHDPDYAQVIHAVNRANFSPEPAEAAVAPVAMDFEGPQPVDRLIQYALNQNPDVHAARKRLEAAALQVPQAASLEDPMLDTTTWPFFPHQPQTASGRMTFDLMLSQEVPWFGKLRANAAAAEAEANAARARLATTELETIDNVKRAYYELYFIQQAISITESERDLLVQIRHAADARYRATLTSQQDLLRAELELSEIEQSLIQLRQQLESAQARLARQLHIAPQTKIRAWNRLTAEDVPRDLDRLERQAVAARPKLHEQVAMLERDRQMVRAARLDYFPDMRFKFGWSAMTTERALAPTADGIDNIAVGLDVNLPIYRKRLIAGVREAEANVAATAREYDSMRDATLEEVLDLFAQARSQQELMTLFEQDILPRARQTLDVSSRAYDVGEVDFLQLLDNFRQLLRYEINYRRLEASLHQTLARLERVIGGYVPPIIEELPAGTEPASPAAQPMLIPPVE